MRVIVCANQKGGVGKTAIATHIAFMAAETGLRVLALDLDAQGTLTRNLSAEFDGADVGSAGLFQAQAVKQQPLDVMVKAARRNGALAVLPGDERLVAIDHDPAMQAGALRAALRAYAEDFDLCVIDPPPTLGKRLEAALVAADFVVMPFTATRESIDGMGQLMATIHAAKESANPGLNIIGFLANQVNTRSMQQRKVLAQVQAAAPGLLLATRISARTSIADMLALSRPVWQHTSGESHLRAAVEMRNACKHILQIAFKK